MHLVGRFIRIVLWCTEPWMSNCGNFDEHGSKGNHRNTCNVGNQGDQKISGNLHTHDNHDTKITVGSNHGNKDNHNKASKQNMNKCTWVFISISCYSVLLFINERITHFEVYSCTILSCLWRGRLLVFGRVIVVYRQSQAEHIITRCGKIRVTAGVKDNYHSILCGTKFSSLSCVPRFPAISISLIWSSLTTYDTCKAGKLCFFPTESLSPVQERECELIIWLSASEIRTSG